MQKEARPPAAGGGMAPRGRGPEAPAGAQGARGRERPHPLALVPEKGGAGYSLDI